MAAAPVGSEAVIVVVPWKAVVISPDMLPVAVSKVTPGGSPVAA